MNVNPVQSQIACLSNPRARATDTARASFYAGFVSDIITNLVTAQSTCASSSWPADPLLTFEQDGILMGW